MSESKEHIQKEDYPTNQKIIKTYLELITESEESKSTRRSCLNYFFKGKYFGYSGHIFDLDVQTLTKYQVWLKRLKRINITTKKLKWTILKGFLEFCMEYYNKYDFIVVIPKHTINWNGADKKEADTNKNVIIEKKELEQILQYLKKTNFKYYLIFRLLAENGMRKGELINADYEDVNIEKRFIKTKGKTGREIYYFSKDLAKYLKMYLKERKSQELDDDALFLSSYKQRYSSRVFNVYLKKTLKEIGIDKNITCHTFRRTLNTYRKKMGCRNEDRKILLNHKVQDVNVASYVKLKYNDFIKLFDKWNPYKKLEI